MFGFLKKESACIWQYKQWQHSINIGVQIFKRLMFSGYK